jgi:CheY-like chemotaxis protein
MRCVQRSMDRPVLIVEDDPTTRDALSALIQAHGLRTVTAEDGDRALQLLRAGLVPCIVVLDLWMPHMDGFTFRAEQLTDPALSRYPVVVCSAEYPTSSLAERLQATAYLQKPVDSDVLLRLIKSVCRAEIQ